MKTEPPQTPQLEPVRQRATSAAVPGALQAPTQSQTLAALPPPRVPRSERGPPGLSPITCSTRARLSSPTGCRETEGITGKVTLGKPPATRRPALGLPRLGGYGWAVSVPASRTVPQAGPSWGTGARAASGSPDHVPADSDTGGPGAGPAGSPQDRVRESLNQPGWDPGWRILVVDIRCLLFWPSILHFP